MQLRTSALDHHCAVDEIHNDVGLRACGELDFFGKNPGRFLEGGRIVDVDCEDVLSFGCPGGRNEDERRNQENEKPGEDGRASQHPSEDHDGRADPRQLIDTLQVIIIQPNAAMRDILAQQSRVESAMDEIAFAESKRILSQHP